MFNMKGASQDAEKREIKIVIKKIYIKFLNNYKLIN